MAIYVDDKELVAAHQAGDTEAFEELVREYRASLFSHGRRKLYCDAAAEDAVQETLVRAYRALPKFNGEYRLGPWLHRIMANVCVDEVNRRVRDGEKINKFAAQPISEFDVPGVEEELGLDFDGSHVTRALEELPDSYSEALKLKFVDELGYSKLAEATGVSEQNARARVSRARSAMRSALRGVAVLPALLFGLLRRGEKAAAAATSGSLAAGSAGITTVSSVATQTSSLASVLPALTETGVVAAKASPVVVPVVAKAAMGLGLAAAALSPGGDGAIQLAVENLTSSSNSVLVEIDNSAGEGNNGNSFSSQSSIDMNNTAGVVNLETLSFAASQSHEDSEASQRQEPLRVIPPSGGSISAEQLDIVAGGAGRFDLLGPVSVVIADETFDGTLTSGSQLRIDPDADVDGRHRIDALLVMELSYDSVVEIRVAGFGVESDQLLDMGGLFKADHPDWQLSQQGSFQGSISFNGSQSSLLLTLAP